mmetsp:Transcript_10119/g.28450  ORF Transcript_10119/g.28450 Transcript_10119/m.28450 type:complete len:244 (+) Transcript_10119:846-1577(+)
MRWPLSALLSAALPRPAAPAGASPRNLQAGAASARTGARGQPAGWGCAGSALLVQRCWPPRTVPGLLPPWCGPPEGRYEASGPGGRGLAGACLCVFPAALGGDFSPPRRVPQVAPLRQGAEAEGAPADGLHSPQPSLEAPGLLSRSPWERSAPQMAAPSLGVPRRPWHACACEGVVFPQWHRGGRRRLPWPQWGLVVADRDLGFHAAPAPCCKGHDTGHLVVHMLHCGPRRRLPHRGRAHPSL